MFSYYSFARLDLLENIHIALQVSSMVKCRLEKKKYDKYSLYLSELDKVLHLMFMLASRLANTENALNCPRPGDNETNSVSLQLSQS